MGTYEEKRFTAMAKIWFDPSTNSCDFLTHYFPDLLTGTSELDRYFNESTWAALEHAMCVLQQDNEKHSLLEMYRFIENEKEVNERLQHSILITVRSKFSKTIIDSLAGGR